jgi:hypothetical protein
MCLRNHWWSASIRKFSFWGMSISMCPCVWNLCVWRVGVCYGIHIYRVSQEESAILREGVPYVKIYWYNPKHLCPKLNGYGDNGQRKVWSSFGSTHCTCQLTSLINVCPWLRCRIAVCCISAVFVTPAIQAAMLSQCVTYSAWNPKDNYDMECEFFVLQFNGFMSLMS